MRRNVYSKQALFVDRLKPLLLSAVLLLSTLTFSGCANSQEPVQRLFYAMDTAMQLTAYGKQAEPAINAAVQRVNEIEALSSAYISGSDVAKINAAAGKAAVVVSPEVLKMIRTAVQYGQKMEGAFDITVGPLISLWGIGTDHQKIPSPEEIQKALTLVGLDDIQINESESSVLLTKPGMSIDLGGIAKGFAADEILRIFREYGIDSALINLGSSSIYALGTKPNGDPWTVAIRHPRKDGEYLCVVQLTDQALATSGDYERYFIKDGKRYHHIFDPATGYPAEAGVMSATVAIDGKTENCCMLADLLTKAAFVSGTDRGFAVVDGFEGCSCMAAGSDNRLYCSQNWTMTLSSVSPDFTLNKTNS